MTIEQREHDQQNTEPSAGILGTEWLLDLREEGWEQDELQQDTSEYQPEYDQGTAHEAEHNQKLDYRLDEAFEEKMEEEQREKIIEQSTVEEMLTNHGDIWSK